MPYFGYLTPWYHYGIIAIREGETDSPDRNQKEDKMTTMTATQTITITSINTKPEIDPYHLDTQGITRTCIELDPQARTVEVFQIEDSNSAPMNVWHNHYYRWYVSEYPSESDMRQWIEDNINLFGRIADGHSIEWNGNNHVGILTEDAQDAYESLTVHDGLGYASHYEAWRLDEWFDATEHEVIGMSDDQIREFAAASMLVDENIALLFDEDEAVEHLIWYRDQ